MAQSIEWASRPYAFLERCAAELGDRFTIDLGVYGAFVIVSAPDDVREVFRADPAVLHAGEGNGVLRRFLGDGSLLLLEEEAHLAERRLLLPAFTQARVRSHLALIERATREALAAPRSDVASLRDAAERLSLAVILRIALGDTLTDEARALETELRALLDDPRFNLALLHQLDDAAPTPAMRGLIDAFASVRDLVERVIAARRASDVDHGDVLSMWLAARTADGAPVPPSLVADELLTLVVTGYETTATALSWAGVWLTRSAHVSGKLAGAVRGTRSGAFHPYVDAVCREVLRVHPVIPIVGRRVCAPFRLGDLELPVGVTVAPSIHLAHRRVATWGDPEAFRPERFLERDVTPYEYFPFGGGARRCLGRELAMLELKVAIAHVAMHGGFTLEDAERVSPRRRSVTIAPVAAPRAEKVCPEKESAA
jgi:cytochrome P450